MGAPKWGGSSITAARLAHPATDAQGQPRTDKPSGFPHRSPLQGRLGRRRSGPPSSRAGPSHHLLRWGGAPWGRTPQRAPGRTGVSTFCTPARSGEFLQPGKSAMGRVDSGKRHYWTWQGHHWRGGFLPNYWRHPISVRKSKVGLRRASAIRPERPLLLY